MLRGRGDVEYEDLRPGNGEVATREHKALITSSITLHHGESIGPPSRAWIDLKRRETIAGVRYGIEGMRIGGIRRIVIPPHLAYGAAGIPGTGIPANALLICEVELLELAPTHPIKPSLKLARERAQRQSTDEPAQDT